MNIILITVFSCGYFEELQLTTLNYETVDNSSSELCDEGVEQDSSLEATVAMFPETFHKLQSIVTQCIEQFTLIAKEEIPKGRPLKISKEDALVFALYLHRSTRATKKSVYDDFMVSLDCSYKTFVCAVNRAGTLALRLLFKLMRLGRKHAHLLKFTDATDIPVCLAKNAKKHRVMKGLAGWGYSGKGFYYGLKMTMTRDDDGRMLGLRFTAPKTNDRDIFREINREIDGIIVADAGYVSKQLEREMYVDGKRWVLIKPFKTMKKLAEAWQLALYNRRFRIEFDFRSLKLFHGLVSSLPRSVEGYISNYLLALTSFVLR